MSKEITISTLQALLDRIIILNSEDRMKFQETISGLSSATEKILWRVGKELEKMLDYQDRLFQQIITNNPEFPSEFEDFLSGLYKDSVEAVTAQEQSDAEKLLNFDDV